MQKHKHIKALFFLGIFSMLLLHQVLPHWHHEHEVEHTHKAVANSNTHSHHHDVPEKESPNKGFLDISTPVSIVHYYSSINYDEAEKIKVYHPPNNYFNPYLSSLNLRGPPSLG